VARRHERDGTAWSRMETDPGQSGEVAPQP